MKSKGHGCYSCEGHRISFVSISLSPTLLIAATATDFELTEKESSNRCRRTSEFIREGLCFQIPHSPAKGECYKFMILLEFPLRWNFWGEEKWVFLSPVSTAYLSMYENPSPPVPLQTSDDLCLWMKLLSASRKVPEKQVHQPVTWREAIHTRWCLSGHHTVESSVGWELSLWCCTIKWKGENLSLEGNQLQREV